MKLEFSGQIVQKYSNIKFHENPLSGTELFHADIQTDGWTDRHEESNSRFSQLCENAYKLKFTPRCKNLKARIRIKITAIILVLVSSASYHSWLGLKCLNLSEFRSQAVIIAQSMLYSMEMSTPFVARWPVVLLVCHLARYADLISYINQYFPITLVRLTVSELSTLHRQIMRVTRIAIMVPILILHDKAKVILCLYTSWTQREYMRYTSPYSLSRSLYLRGKQYTVKPRFTNASDHEQFGLRINFPNTKRLGWRTVSRVTNTQAVNIVER